MTVNLMIRVAEAQQRILADLRPLEVETVKLPDARGRVAAEEIRAGRAIPPWDHSGMDGYALRTGDTAGASVQRPVRLEVIETIPAGGVATRRIGPGQAARIMTGAPLPEGADGVVMLEDCRQEGPSVFFTIAATAGRHIRRTGDDVSPGETVLRAGDRIRPADIGLLASLGRATVSVYRRPLVAVVATGSELTEIDTPPAPGKIVGSNRFTLAALVEECGALPLTTGLAADRREELAFRFREAGGADLIVSAGGVSAGDFDFVKEILRAPGNRIAFWQVAMKPGKPFAFGALGQVPVAALPGNPAAAMVCFWQFARPAIRRMLGHRDLFPGTALAKLARGIEKKRGFRHFIPARLSREADGGILAEAGAQGAGMIKSLLRANGLIVLDEETASVAAGDRVRVQLLDDSLNFSPEPEW
jgi:molybdopterin molybdotransferase